MVEMSATPKEDEWQKSNQPLRNLVLNRNRDSKLATSEGWQPPVDLARQREFGTL
jgi:hypothetical protein